ncbi:unnamed protein product [Sphacelaria rigidula]
MDLNGTTEKSYQHSNYGVDDATRRRDVQRLPREDRRRRQRPYEKDICTCFLSDEWEGEARPNTIKSGGGCDALAAEALGMLCEVEKDRILMQMHERIRQLTGRVEEVTSFSESAISRLQRVHEVSLREHEDCEHQLREDLDMWQHHHPKVEELLRENNRLREQSDRSKRDYLVALMKLTRMSERRSQDRDLAARAHQRRGGEGMTSSWR